MLSRYIYLPQLADQPNLVDALQLVKEYMCTLALQCIGARFASNFEIDI